MRAKRNRLIDWAILIGPVLFLVIADQVSKWLVRQNLAVGEMWAPIPALSKIFTFTHVQNTGVSFGQLPGMGWIFMLVNLAVLIGILIFYPRIPSGMWQLRVASALILAGALGNWIDRLRTAFLYAEQTGSLLKALPLASVTDFVDFAYYHGNLIGDAVAGDTFWSVFAIFLFRPKAIVAGLYVFGSDTGILQSVEDGSDDVFVFTCSVIDFGCKCLHAHCHSCFIRLAQGFSRTYYHNASYSFWLRCFSNIGITSAARGTSNNQRGKG